MRVGVVVALLAIGAAAAPPDNLPAECWGAVHLDVRTMRTLPVYEAVLRPWWTEIIFSRGMESFCEETGYTLDRIDTITAGFGGDTFEERRLYIAIRGSFDTAKMDAALARQPYYVRTREGKATIFTSEFGTQLALLDGGAFLISSAPKALIAAPRHPVTRLLADAGPAPLRVALLPPRKISDELKMDPDLAPLAAVRSLVATVKGVDTLTLEGAFTAPTDEEAARVHAHLEKMAKALERVDRFTREGRVVRSSTAASLASVTRLARLFLGLDEPDPNPATRGTVLRYDGAPSLNGAGRIARVVIRNRVRQVNEFWVAPGEQHVTALVAAYPWVVCNADLRIVRSSLELNGPMAFTRDGRRGIWYSIDRLNVRPLATLTTAESLAGAVPGDPQWIVPLPDGKAFMIVGGRRVHAFHTGPLRWGRTGKLATARVSGVAIDPKTALLVVTGMPRTLELYDPVRMETRGGAQLPCRTLTYGVVAAGGHAWVGTKEGTLLPFDVHARRVGKPLRLAPTGEVRAGLSHSGQLLVVSCEQLRRGDRHPTRLTAYRVERGALTEIATAVYLSPQKIENIAVLESRETVLLAGAEPLVWQYGAR